MSDTRIGTVERAFQLAREGACRSVSDIRERLTAEGYEGVFSHLNGMSIRRQLTDALVARGVTTPVESDDV
ncbi:hypothetical protein [Sphingomonas sp. Leaf30]|uniref:hypothetical protein n=1 Tax=Sphingomonas sp. Leaf30 TaxID=1736213 RepID=UPI000B20B846|nr:hypothetical protein [Sphingomonas sp. Leaf30]